ncbi:MAG: response regulator [Myxococcales bacterium]|nr:response regulator [Myxococcales bacterium]
MPDAPLILLVDDSPADNFLHRLVIRETLSDARVEEAMNGEQALARLRAASAGDAPTPTLLLLDINMPRMNGWEFLEAAAEESLFGDCVVVALLTTSIDPAEKERSKTFGVVRAHLEKPLTAEALREVIALAG